jgi:hypothetical protein
VIDEEIDASKRPRTEHVLQRLTGEPTGDHVRDALGADRGRRLAFDADEVGSARAGDLFHHPARLARGMLETTGFETT